MKNILLILLFLCLSAISVHARDFTVSIEVRADSPEMGKTVESILAAELSSQKDVRISENGDWNLRVMVMENKVPEGAEKSFTVSAVITSRAKCAVSGGTESCDRFEDLGIFAGAMPDLRDMCEELIADFVESNLAPQQ